MFIDGKYQCNRSKPAGGEGEGVGVELRLRQREEKVFHGGRGEGERGVFVGREWRWVELDVGMCLSCFSAFVCGFSGEVC